MIVFTSLLCVALFHGIKVLKSLRRIMDRVEEGTEIIAEDMQNVRAYFSEDGILRRLFMKLMGFSQKEKGDNPKPRKHDKKRTELKINDEI